MEFILEQQARIAEQQSKADRRINAITKLMGAGMKMLVRNEAEIKSLIQTQKKNEERLARLEEMHRSLEEKHRRSDEKFERLLAAFIRRMSNGHS